MRKENGITIITLVITIIVIIILSTVTINVALGDNGLIEQAQQTKNSAEQSITDETAKMNEILQEYSNTMAEDVEIAEPEKTTIEENLEEGDYVYYVDGTGVTRECVVLYGPENANYSSYGIQIIPMETVENVTLGYGDTTAAGSDYFTKSMNSYNNAINTLNNATSKYLNTTYAESVRCVGSVPDNPSYDEAGMFTSSYSYMSSYNGLFKDTDTNYQTDWNQMNSLNINDINDTYWLASRDVSSDSSQSNFNVRNVFSNGSLSRSGLCLVNSNR